MNKDILEMDQSNEKKFFLKADSRLKDILIISLLACVLMFAVWQIFGEDGKEEALTVFSRTESEQKITQILSQIEGVGDVEVMIGETDEQVNGVVVVCEGANNFRVVMDIREAVCAALGTDEKDVKIYLKD